MRDYSNMTPEEEQAYVDELNEVFKESLPIINDIEIGEVDDMRWVKLRAHVNEIEHSMESILLDLSLMLERRRIQFPDTKGMIVSEMKLTIPIQEVGFCPRRGFLIKIKYI